MLLNFIYYLFEISYEMGNQESQDMKTNYMHVNSQKNLHQKQQLIPHVTSSNPTFQHINFEPQLNKQSTG